MNPATPGLLQTRKHFEILDGMRGIAALAVVLFHFMEMAYSDYSQNFIAHGFLAVDFFFCLSGFVIPYAYDNRIDKMGLKEFFKSRLIRLHPLVVLGSVLGLLAFLFDPFGGHPELYSAGKIILIFIASVFLIPYPVIVERSFNLFGLNAPAWSLFWEYVANIFYAFILHRLSRVVLTFLLIPAAIFLWITCQRAGGSLMGGWGGENFWDGGARIGYSFLAGMLVYRWNLVIKSRIGFWGLSAMLALAFVMPFNDWNWLTEPLVVLFYFPFLVALGAGGNLAPRDRRFCILSGEISYPLYMTHYAVIWMFLNFYTKYKPGTLQLFWIIFTGTIVLLLTAFVVMKFYDIPVRKYLTAKRKAIVAKESKN
jgi:peptidoglycan/LPS O-acetylase OafA/YrhL